jgi:hypothetical protein
MAHTPGPWRTSRPTEPFGCIWAGEMFLGEVSDANIPTDIARANARLMALGPELLAALRGMVELVEQINDTSNEGGLLDERYDAACDALYKAARS